MTNLKVGFYGKNLQGWYILLEQIGIPFSIIDDTSDISKYIVIIISDDFNEHGVEGIKEYLKKGGAVLCSAKFFDKLSGQKSKKVYAKYLFEAKDSMFTGIGLVDIYSEIYLHQGANTLMTDNYELALLVDEYCGGYISVFPFDAGELILNYDTVAKSFYSTRNRLPYENVSSVSKGKIRRLVSVALEHLFHKRGMPYIHKWYFPNNLPTIFSYRIDTDFASENEVKSLLNIIDSNGIKTSWFVDVESQEKHLYLYCQMVEHEIGLHGFKHKFYNNYEKNLLNIQRALEVFELNNLKAKSFTAPFGRWSSEIAMALSKYDFEYSSEFSYDYDNLPSHRLLGNGNELLQIPIHPICIGSLCRQGFKENSMIEYFENVIEEKYQNREPIFLYHHPKDNNERVVKYVFDKIKCLNLMNLRMIDFAQWWKRRSQANLQVSIDGERLHIIAQGVSPDCWIHLTNPTGSEAFCPINSIVDLSNLNWVKCPIAKTIPSDLKKIRRYNPWVMINRIEDNVQRILRKVL